MKRIYLLLLLCCVWVVGRGQATPSCTTTSASWTTSGSHNYGVDGIDIVGYSGSTLSDVGIATSCGATTGYLDETTAVPAISFQQGTSYSSGCDVTWGTASSYQFAQVWIDFNDDGIFDVTEEVTPVFGYTSSGTTISPTPMTISIPLGAALGTHLMRMRGIWEYISTDIGSAPAHVDPCLLSYGGVHPQYYSGTCVDYHATIVALPTCTGTPSAGTTVADVTTACPGVPFNVNIVGYSGASDFTYQWMASTDGGVTYTAIAGATNPTYNTTITLPTYFELTVTCPSSGLSSTSTPVFVNYVGYCYCVPSYYYGVSSYDGISEFILNGYSGSTIDDYGPSTIASYEDQTSISINLQQGNSYTGTINYLAGEYPLFENQIWIDFNNDGIFDVSEEVTPVFGSTEASYATSANFTLTVPFAAATGTHRMRVRNVVSYASGFSSDEDPCATSDASMTYYYGTTRDYTVDIIALPPCSGTPTAGTTIADVTVGCPSTSFNLGVSGYSTAIDYTFQWSSSTDGITYTAIAGATSLTYSTSIATPTYFELTITCPTSGLSSTSVPVFINYVGYCYCTPTYYYSSPSTTNAMGNFNMTGASSTLINDDGPAVLPASGYEDRTAIDSITLQQNGSYSGTVTYLSSNYYPYENQIWIDFNNDGIFDVSEEVTSVFGSGGCGIYASSSTFTANIPFAAATGYHRMRVRNAYEYYSSCSPSTHMDPCASYDASSTYYDGVTRDYTANIVPLPPCTGTPTAGVAHADVMLGCPLTAFNLSVTGESSAFDLTFQWKVSTDGGATYTNIAGATTLAYAATESAPSYYEVVVTCPSSGLSATSTPVFVNYFGYCFCTPSYYYSVAPYHSMTNFTLATYSGTLSDDSPAGAPASGYIDNTITPSDTVTLQQSGTYAGSVNFSSTYYYAYENQVWIDFNNDGIFAISEEVTPVFGVGYFVDPSSISFTLTVPFAAATGYHRMRVRSVEAFTSAVSADMDPCASSDASWTYDYGMAVDYTVNIIPLPPCSGTPTAGTALASVAMACPATAFTLSLSGTTASGDLTFQWQSSPDGITWTNITGATTITYVYTTTAALYYHCVVTCPTSTLSSTSSSVFVNYVGYCYCVPTYYYAPFGTYSDHMTTVSIPGYGGTAISDAGPSPAPSSGYEDETFDTVSFQQGQMYPGTVANNYSDEYQYQIWIDFNNNGTFETSEEVTPVFGNLSSYLSSASFTISIPFTAPTGYHRMRIRNATVNAFGSGSFAADMAPCDDYDDTWSTYYYGTARDYTVNVILLPPCSGTPAGGVAASTATLACPTTPFTVSVTGYTSASDITYQWMSSTDGVTYTAVAGATSLTYTTTITTPTYYELVLTCPTSGLTGTSTPVFVNYYGFCYCTPTYYYSPASTYESFTGFAVTGFAGTSISDMGPAVVPASGYEDRTTISATMQQGGAYSGTITYTNAEYDPYSNQIWIDFNNNGTFEATEEVTPVFGSTYGGYEASSSFTINIPATAATGTHRMRVRNAWTYYYTSISTEMDPCNDNDAYIGNYLYGLSRDYTVNIVPLCTYTYSLPSASTVCPNTSLTFAATTTATSYSWAGPGGYTSTLLDPTVSIGTGTSTYTLTLTDGTCATTLTTTIHTLTPPPAPVVSPADTAICSGSSLMITAIVPADTVNLIPAESWESGGPTDATIPVDGWSTDASSAGYITFGTSGSHPSGVTAEDGSHFANFHSYTYSSGTTVNLTSPNFNMTGVSGGQVSFWVYRDAAAYTGSSYSTEGWTILINTSTDVTTATSLGFVPRAYNDATTGVTGVSTPSAAGWYQYSVAIPSTYTGTTNNIFINAYSEYGNDCYMDNIHVTGAITLPAPTWTPAATLYSDAGLTTPYVAGTATTTVYALPVGGTTPTVVDYVAGVTDGTCSAYDTSFVTVNPGPAITGTLSVCVGGTTTLTPASPGGTWSTVSGSIATVSGGVVSGHAVGTTTLSYVLPSGCYSTATITVNPLPSAITGSMIICGVGGTTTLSGDAGDTWSATGAGTVSTSGVVTGSAIGTVIVTNTNASGCSVTASVSVNDLPAAITGASSICEGATAALGESTTGGTWSATGAVSVDATGVITGLGATGTSGTGTVTYTAATGGCYVTYPIAVNATPAPITGSLAACVGNTTALSDVTTGGTWSPASGGGAASVSSTGVVTGLTIGTQVITYSLGSCSATATVTVGSAPASIVGLIQVCPGASITLTDVTAPGTWSISPAGTAGISTTGVVTGASSGTATATYTVPGGCYVTSTITVNPLPAAISGTTTVCLGLTTTLTDASAPGTWFASPSAIATVDGGGVVTGAGVGSGTVTFTSSTTGCSITTPVTVSPLPAAIYAPITSVCVGSVLALSDATPSGTWSSAPMPVATVDATGSVTGNAPGTALVSYSVAGCSVNTTITVNPVVTPAVAITAAPGTTICAGTTVTFTATPSNGGPSPFYQWTVNSVNVGTSSPIYTYVPANGDVVGVTMITSLPCATVGSVSTNVTMVVTPIVTPAATVYVVPGTPVPVGTSDTFAVVVASGAGSAPTYQWYLNGVAVSGATSMIYIDPTMNNGDVVTCTVTNNDLCGGTFTASSGVINTWGVGVNNVVNISGSVNVIPNPNNGTFTVKGNLGVNIDEDVKLVITDMLGQVVFKDVVRAKNGVIEQQILLSNTLANGMYILDVRSEHVAGTFHFVLAQ